MFLLTIPKGEHSGKCRINCQPAEFRVTEGTISFRMDGEADWQERQILDQSDSGDLVQYFCDDGPESEGPYTVIEPGIDQQGQTERFYWLAINGPSVSAGPIPLPRTVRAYPVPEQMIGFRTREEQLAIQKFLLTAPISEVTRFMTEEMPRKLRDGQVVAFKLAKPDAPSEQTIWVS